MSSKIIRAVRRGDLESVLRFPTKVEDADYDKRTALHWAAANGRADIVRALVSMGADMNARDMHWLTPLHLASMHGQPETVSALIDCGARRRVRSKWGYEPVGVTCLLARPQNRAAINRMLLRGRREVSQAEAGRVSDWVLADGEEAAAALYQEDEEEEDEGEDEFYLAQMALIAAVKAKSRAARSPNATTGMLGGGTTLKTTASPRGAGTTLRVPNSPRGGAGPARAPGPASPRETPVANGKAKANGPTSKPNGQMGKTKRGGR